MRRSQDGGLRFADDRSHLQDPDVVEHELFLLSLRSGSRYADSTIALALSQVMDPDEMERQRLRRHMFLARWGRQSVTQWEDIDGRMVRRYVSVLADMLEEENQAAKRAVEDAKQE